VRRFFWIVFLLLDGVFITLFIAAYAAKYVHPVYIWWLGVIAIGFPYLSVLLVVPTVVVIWKKKWRLVAFHLFLLLLAAFRLGPYGRLFKTYEPAPGDLSLMTYNVPRWGSQEMPDKTEAMKLLVQSEEPDVICLQEASLHFFQADSILQAEPYVSVLYDSLGYQTIAPPMEHEAFTQQPVLSRFSMIAQTETALQLEATDSQHGSVTRTQLLWKGRDFTVFNIRFHSLALDKPWQQSDSTFWSFDSWKEFMREYKKAYRAQAWEVEQVRIMLEKEEGPFIICGDFNSTPHNWVYARLDGLQDAFALVGKGPGLTYHRQLPIARIDFVLLSPEWEVTSAYLPVAALSDHRPVVVNLRWKP